MTRRALISLFVRQFALTLAALALMFQAAVPAGFMPGVSADGLPEIVLCTGQGPVTLKSGDLFGDGQKQTPPAGHDQHPCVFAGAHAPAQASEAPALPRTASPVNRIVWFAPPARAPSGSGPVSLPPSRAPPAAI